MAIYIARVIIDPSIVAKLNTKHQVTEAEVRESLEWPARVRVASESHPAHGLRWIAVRTTSTGRPLLATLLPAQEWAGELAEEWVAKTVRWL